MRDGKLIKLRALRCLFMSMLLFMCSYCYYQQSEVSHGALTRTIRFSGWCGLIILYVVLGPRSAVWDEKCEIGHLFFSGTADSYPQPWGKLCCGR